MAFELRYDSVFRADYKREMRAHPELLEDFKAAVRELIATGTVPAEYMPHALSTVGGNYSGHIDFHLSDGRVDIIVLYLPHKTNPTIRLVRMGPHPLLFQGPMR